MSAYNEDENPYMHVAFVQKRNMPLFTEWGKRVQVNEIVLNNRA